MPLRCIIQENTEFLVDFSPLRTVADLLAPRGSGLVQAINGKCFSWDLEWGLQGHGPYFSLLPSLPIPKPPINREMCHVALTVSKTDVPWLRLFWQVFPLDSKTGSDKEYLGPCAKSTMFIERKQMPHDNTCSVCASSHNHCYDWRRWTLMSLPHC